MKKNLWQSWRQGLLLCLFLYGSAMAFAEGCFPHKLLKKAANPTMNKGISVQLFSVVDKGDHFEVTYDFDVDCSQSGASCTALSNLKIELDADNLYNGLNGVYCKSSDFPKMEVKVSGLGNVVGGLFGGLSNTMTGVQITTIQDLNLFSCGQGIQIALGGGNNGRPGHNGASGKFKVVCLLKELPGHLTNPNAGDNGARTLAVNIGSDQLTVGFSIEDFYLSFHDCVDPCEGFTAGVDAHVNLCNQDNKILDLNATVGLQETLEGVWNILTPCNVNLSNPLSVDLNGLNAGVYLFEHKVENECGAASALAEIEIEAPLNAGVDASVKLCAGDSKIIDLNACLGLGNTLEGVWNILTPCNADVSNPLTVDLAGLSAGVYVFEHVVSDDCETKTALVNVEIEADLNVGVDADVKLCIGDSKIIDLNAALGLGDVVEGVWNILTPCNADLSNPLSVDLAGLEAGVYVFEHSMSNDCGSKSATITVEIEADLNVGVDADIKLCIGDSKIIDLNAALGLGDVVEGVWSILTPCNADLSNPLSVDLAGLEAGVYVFEHSMSNDCGSKSATITVEIEADLNVGVDADVKLCIGDSKIIDLNAALGLGDVVEGVWNILTPCNADLSNPLSVDLAGLEAGVYVFEHSMSNDCGSKSATITVEIEADLNVGVDADIKLCIGDSKIIDLNAALGLGDVVQGVWNVLTPCDADLSNPLSVDLAGLEAGVYVFEHSMSNDCGSKAATITVEIEADLNVGVDADVKLCIGDSKIIDLNAALGLGDVVEGVWNILTPCDADLSNPLSVDLAGLEAGVYVFEHSMSNDCGSKSATVTIEIEAELNAGIDAEINLCLGEDNIVDINAAIGLGNVIDGVWNIITPCNADLSNPLSVDLSGLTVGVYKFKHEVSGDCGTAKAVLTINIEDCGHDNGNECGLYATVSYTDVTCDEYGTITVANQSGGAGWYMYSLDGGQCWDYNAFHGWLPEGTYHVMMRDGEDCSCILDLGIVEIGVDLKGGYSRMAATGTTEEFTLYPNPSADGAVNIEMPSSVESVSYRVMTLAGVPLMEGESQAQTLNLDLGVYPAGQYLIQLTDSEGNVTMKKVTLQ